VTGLLEGVAVVEVEFVFLVHRLVVHQQGDAKAACGFAVTLGEVDEAAAPGSLRQQQPALLELAHGCLDGLVVHAQLGGEQVLAG
jgi:hypothetical protein